MLPIGDRDEPGPLPLVNVTLIVLNFLVFVLLQLPNENFTNGYSAVPAEITSGQDLVGPVTVTLPDGTPVQIDEAPGPRPLWITLFTSMFMHGGWLHLLGNMLFLFIFGDNVERAFGQVKYLLFYLACGLIASLAQVYSDPLSPIPSLGASGAISGVLAAYLVMFPRNPVRVLIMLRIIPWIIEVPALVMIGLWALLQFVNWFAGQTDGVAYAAHVGGFVAGLVLGFLLRPFSGGPSISYRRA
ncbi:MAG TPA: rhomboid family intramembrane serine protease [Candidatus Dormibacteraeota bacterium]|nr:rhomboid family intramembrane serine protease [Candidatus Dormibacteraeota bacterium]